MAGGTLESTFGIKTLSGLVKTFADEPGQKLFTDLFEKSGKRIEPDGRIVEWDEVTMARALAPVVGESAPFPDATSTQIVARQAPMFDIKLKVDIPASRLFSDRAAGELKDNAASVIANEVQSLTKRVMLTREYAACKALEGSFATSGVAGSSITFTLSQTTNTLTEAASWSTEATKILSSEIPLIVADVIATAGMVPGIAIITDLEEKKLLANDEIRSWAQQQFGASALYNNSASEKVLDGLSLGGVQWYKSVGGFVPEGGSFTRFMTAGRQYWLPAQNMLGEVLGMAEGFGYVPTGRIGGINEAAGLVAKAPTRGFYAYAEGLSNPAGVRLYVGWKGLFFLAFPSAVEVLTTT